MLKTDVIGFQRTFSLNVKLGTFLCGVCMFLPVSTRILYLSQPQKLHFEVQVNSKIDLSNSSVNGYLFRC